MQKAAESEREGGEKVLIQYLHQLCWRERQTDRQRERERERERESTKHVFHANYNAFHGRQIGSFAFIFQIILQFIWISSLRGSKMQSGLSSKRCGLITSRTELKHCFFNLFISCQSTLCKQQNFYWIHSCDLKTGNALSKHWHRKCSVLMTTETEWPIGTLTHQRFF